MSSFQGLEQRGFTVYRGVLISGVGTEEFHCIQRCSHFRGWNRGVPLYTEVFSFQGLEQRSSTVYRGVLISGGWNRGVPLYTEVFSFQGLEQRSSTLIPRNIIANSDQENPLTQL